MVLVLNSPSILWNIICWIVNIFQSLPIQQYGMITRQAITQVVEHSPFAFRCMSEYIFFIMFTLIYAILKTALHVVWLPATGLLWWFKFYCNTIDDANGRSILQSSRIQMLDTSQIVGSSIQDLIGSSFQEPNVQQLYQLAFSQLTSERMKTKQDTSRSVCRPILWRIGYAHICITYGTIIQMLIFIRIRIRY